MKFNKKEGISLLALIITVVVIIILSGAIILALSNTNLISQASKSVFFTDVGNFKDELTLYKGKQFLDKLGNYNSTLLQANGDSITYGDVVDNTKSINDLIPSLGRADKYAGQFEVVDGELVFQGSDPNKQKWSEEIGVGVIIVGEPKISIIPKSETVVLPGTDIIYSIKFSSNAPLKTINLTDKVEILNNAGATVQTQPVINISNISGTAQDVIRYAEITIKTNTLVAGEYKLKIKSGSVINAEGISNSQDTTSLTGFEVVDIIPPENPIMSATPTSWTNGNVTVKVTYSVDSEIKEYSLDGTSWSDYTGDILVDTNNTTVYAKATDASGNESGQSTLTVANIDKVVPTAIYGTNGGTNIQTASTVVTASDLGGSNIASLAYIWDTQSTLEPTSGWVVFTNGDTITKTSVTGTYYLWVKVLDNAGNVFVTKSNSFILDNTPPTNPSISAEPTGWTNGNVTVTVTYPSDASLKQYSLDGFTWNTYTAPVVVTTNNTTVYAMATDISGNQSGQSTLTVANIDKTPPIVVASSGGATSSSITINASSSDINGSGVNVSSYQYSKDNGATWTTQTSVASYTFSSITTGTYQCKVKVLDNAGNASESVALPIATTGLGTISMSASPTGWTNGNVTVTVTYPAEIVTKQYSTDAVTWNIYTAPIIVTNNNTTIYARGIDAGGNQTTQATVTIANIDKVVPTITFGTNGKTTYSKSANTTVTVNDNVSVNTSSLKYQWSTSTMQPTEASFTAAFTNGSTITTPAGASGSYYLWILAKDTSNNTTIINSNAFNIDNTSPIITIVGSNPAGVTVGSAYVDEGAVASDNVNGNITSSIQVTSNVNTSVKGSYTVTYNVTDSSGNAATTVVRTVTVMDAITSFNYTSGNQTFVVPVTGTYIITAVGAAGGSSGYNTVGKGALVEGTFALIQGQVINLVAGGQGASVSAYSGAGGGGRRWRNICIQY